MRISTAAGAVFFSLLFSNAGAARGQGLGGDSESRAELILDLIRGLEQKDAAGKPSVLAGVDPRTAPPENRKVAKVLKETRITLDLEKRGLDETIDLLRQISGITFVVSPKARKAIDEGKPLVSLALRDLPLENVLNLLALHLGDYRFQVRYGAVMLVSAEEYSRPRIARIYDISDLIRPIPDFPAPKLGLTGLEEEK